MSRLILFFLAVSMMALVGCGSASGPSDPPSVSSPGPLMSEDGLVKIEIQIPGVLFVRPDHMIGTYDKFKIPPSVMSYKRRSAKLPEDLQNEFLAVLEQTLHDAVTDAGIPVVEKPGTCVLEIQMGVVGVDLPRARPSAGGTMKLLMVFRDSESGETLLRFAADGVVPSADEGEGSRSERIRDGLNQMVEYMDIATPLRAARSGQGIPVREPCNSSLAKVGTGMMEQP